MARPLKEAHQATSADLESSITSDVPAGYENLPPGTVLLENTAVSTGHGKGGHVLLQPTPSRDPNE